MSLFSLDLQEINGSSQRLEPTKEKRCLVIATKHNISIELIKCAKYINLAKLKKSIKKNE